MNKAASHPRNSDRSLAITHLVSLPLELSKQGISTPLLLMAADANQAQQLYAAWRFFAPHQYTILFKDWELLPYERFSPQQDLISERLLALWKMRSGQVDVIITTVTAMMQKLPPVDFIMQHTLQLKKKQALNVISFKENLLESGYQHVSQVLSPREFSIRGGVIDLFAISSSYPYRIDLFDNEIDSIHTFDPINQRRLKEVTEIRLLSAYEFPTDQESICRFKRRFCELFTHAKHAIVYQSLKQRGIFAAGIESYFPLFFEGPLSSLWEYLPSHTTVLSTPQLKEIAHYFAQEIQSRFQLAGGDESYPPLPPSYLYLSEQEQLDLSDQYLLIYWQMNQPDNAMLPDISINRRLNHPLQPLADFMERWPGRTLILADSLGRSEIISNLLQEHGLNPQWQRSFADFQQEKIPLGITVFSEFTSGFILPEYQLAFITESELYQGQSRHHQRRRSFSQEIGEQIMDLAEIKEGDLLVHEAHGIGRYKGLEKFDEGENAQEFMHLTYHQGASLYVPVSQIHLVSRYRGTQANAVQLHTLGSDKWHKQKQKALQQARDTAADLLDIYAQRELQRRPPYEVDHSLYTQFVEGFIFEETPDQARAIEEILQDMRSSRPMDRLICADVGFGKTEVALRAAFVAAMSGRQVALLAPTTLLVDQHTQTFVNRLLDFPIKVEGLSRFSGTKDSQRILDGLKNGAIDIVIGTDKLIQRGVNFHNLGLLIIDEEHRFGVRQKEALKKYRAQVDVLTMTATPIPRTLSLALEKLRDFSLISTAPEKRLAVKTVVHTFSSGLIQEAVWREIKRGGQVFFVHNDIASIEGMREQLQILLPKVRICLAHGRMHERELEQVMRGFLRHQYDMMLCTTIVETGLDISNANTIIINRADKFGLAQLHQLRGRVGRSSHQAYAYLLLPETIGKEAEKRVEAIRMASELGAGFFLAMQDLEIRGSGEVLGANQSGEIQQVGLSLYSDMLRQAVKFLQRGEQISDQGQLTFNAEIKLHHTALLPESYCPNVHERLLLYKKLAQAVDKTALDSVLEELIDRFGLLPPASKLLLDSHYLRLKANFLGISLIDAAEECIKLVFAKHTLVKPEQLIALIQKQPKNFQLKNGNQLLFKINESDPFERILLVNNLLNALNPVE
jgi:transcription-repair coupling factor